MFGDTHIVKVAEATNYAITSGLYKYLLHRFSLTEQSDFAVALAAGTAMNILGRRAEEPKHQEFRILNSDRIYKESEALQSEAKVREVLSGAAYNIGYGRYVKHGGGRLNNRFVGFIRLDRRKDDPEYRNLLSGARQELNQRNSAILEEIISLQRLGLWISRSENPNEVAYLQAAQSFANEQ